MVKWRQAHLSKDSKVEVCSNEEGYRGPWFSAIILDPEPSDPATNNKRNNLGNSSKALAQYDNLVSDDDPNKPLTELVDVRSIRPVPPPDNPDRPFHRSRDFMQLGIILGAWKCEACQHDSLSGSRAHFGTHGWKNLGLNIAPDFENLWCNVPNRNN